MATLSDYMSGTISLANGSVTVTGTGTLFEVTRFREGDTLQIQNLTAVIASVDSDTQLTLAEPWTGIDIVDGPYRARQLGDGSRVSTQAATIIELLGNGVLMNLTELGVEEGKVPVGGPTGEYELKPYIDDETGSLTYLAKFTPNEDEILSFDADGKPEYRDKDNAFPHGLTVGTILHVEAEGSAEIDFGVKGYGTGPVIHGYCAWGTKAAPLSLGAGAMALGIGSRPFTGTDWAEHSTAAFHFITREQITPTNQGTSLRMLVTPIGSDWSKRKEVLRLESDGEAVGSRIRGNFNGTISNRTYFQSIDTAALNTTVAVLPAANDVNANGALAAFAAVTPENAAFLMLQAYTTKVSLISGRTGTADYAPLLVNVGGLDRAKVSTDGRIFINSDDILPSYSSLNYLNIRATPGSISPLRLETNNASGTLAMFVTNAGLAGSIFASGTSTTYSQTSDQQLKIDDGELSEDAALAVLEQLYFHLFRWKFDDSDDIGVFAQELYDVYPKAVVVGHGEPGDADYTPWGVDYSKLVPVLGRCLQSVNRRLRDVEGKLNKAA
ncbi:tail fiber domain-containing protein [Brucella anthropi]|uniref:tail fiber domain-containing protein n=1 Tax=Brucella anthropi TaxID=529 RepID=UPI000AFBAEB9|nr:tail fiber domain-containing protein [Brucella anthropi]